MSQLPSDLPQLPKWPFLCMDALLLGTAAVIAFSAQTPLQGGSLIAVVACVAFAACLCAIPFITDYARAQDQALDERQRALESLAKNVTNSAEQLGIAIQGLGRLDEQLQRHIRHIDLVPQKLNERLAELQQRLASTRDEELEEMERELATLRASEGDRLETVMEQLQKTTAELARSEAVTAKQVEEGRSLVANLSASSADAALRLNESLDQSVRQSVDRISDTINSACAQFDKLLSDSQSQLSAQLDASLTASRHTLLSDSQSAEARLESLSLAIKSQLERSASQASELSDDFFKRMAANLEDYSLKLDQQQALASAALPAPVFPHPEPVAPVPQTALPSEEVPESLAVSLSDSPPAPEPGQAAPSKEILDSKAPVSAGISEAAALSPVTPPALSPSLDPEPLPPTSSGAPSNAPGRSPRKKSEPVPAGMVFDLFTEHFSLEAHHSEEPAVSRSVTADGATRIVVTAYIGIGNKLFIRGDAPGLSWTRGRPLEFVSIGRWRWDTLEAELSFNFKLYKNDQQECVNLGLQTIDVGQQLELHANF